MSGLLADAISNWPIGAVAAQLGLSGVFLWQWQGERKERQALQREAAEVARLTYPVLATVGRVLEKVEQSMSRAALIEELRAKP